MEDARIHKLLWALRLHRSRPLAASACEAGHVTIGDHPVKPGRKVRPGEEVRIRLPELTRTLRILALPRSRVSAKQVSEYAVDLTPPEEYERARQAAAERARARRHAADGGRPTKKDRRSLSKLLAWED